MGVFRNELLFVIIIIPDLFFFSKISPDHLGIGANLCRGALGNLTPKIEDDNPVCNVHDHSHIMFDKDDTTNTVPENSRIRLGGSLTFENINDESGNILLFLQVHPCHGLIEKQGFRLQS